MLASIGKSGEIGRVYFERSTAILNQESTELVEKIAKSEFNTNSCLVLYGFISPNLESSYHNLLGRTRELEVFRQLSNRGILPNRMAFRSLGITDKKGELGPGLQKNYISIAIDDQTRDCASRRIKLQTHAITKTSSFATGDVLSITFTHRSADPEALDLKAIAAFVSQHKHDGNFRIAVDGHSDSQGAESYNRLLSKLRALKAYQLVVDCGFPGKFVDINYYGNTKPVTNSKTIAAYKQNRRVNLRWQSVSTETPKLVQKAEPMPPEISIQSEVRHEEEKTEEVIGSWEPGLFLGYISANSSVASSVKSALQFGAFLRFHLADHDSFVDAYEFSYSRHSHKSHIDSVDGHFTVQGFRLGGARTFETPYLSPTVHLNLGVYKWSANALEESTSRTQDDSGTTFGPSLRLGRVFSVGRHIKIEPQIELEYLAKGLGLSRGLLIEFGWRL